MQVGTLQEQGRFGQILESHLGPQLHRELVRAMPLHVPVGIAHVLYYFALKRIGATIPSLLQLASPVLVLGISRVWFGEALNSWQYVFGVLLLAGAALAVKAQQHLAPATLDSKC